LVLKLFEKHSKNLFRQTGKLIKWQHQHQQMDKKAFGVQSSLDVNMSKFDEKRRRVNISNLNRWEKQNNEGQLYNSLYDGIRTPKKLWIKWIITRSENSAAISNDSCKQKSNLF